MKLLQTKNQKVNLMISKAFSLSRPVTQFWTRNGAQNFQKLGKRATNFKKKQNGSKGKQKGGERKCKNWVRGESEGGGHFFFLTCLILTDTAFAFWFKKSFFRGSGFRIAHIILACYFFFLKFLTFTCFWVPKLV